LERIALQKEPEQGALDLVMEFCPAIEEVAQVLVAPALFSLNAFLRSLLALGLSHQSSG
jgi:hypothetical protein